MPTSDHVYLSKLSLGEAVGYETKLSDTSTLSCTFIFIILIHISCTLCHLSYRKDFENYFNYKSIILICIFPLIFKNELYLIRLLLNQINERWLKKCLNKNWLCLNIHWERMLKQTFYCFHSIFFGCQRVSGKQEPIRLCGLWTNMIYPRRAQILDISIKSIPILNHLLHFFFEMPMKIFSYLLNEQSVQYKEWVLNDFQQFEPMSQLKKCLKGSFIYAVSKWCR